MRDRKENASGVDSSYGLDDYLADVWEWESPAFTEISMVRVKHRTVDWQMLGVSCSNPRT